MAKLTKAQMIKKGGDIGYMSPQMRAMSKTGGIQDMRMSPMKKKTMLRKRISTAAERMMGGK